MPVRHEGTEKVQIESWGSHVDHMIREAQARGDFDRLPGAGKPLNLEENVFAGGQDAAYRMAKSAGAAPLWVDLDKEISQDEAALAAMLERTAAYFTDQVALLNRRGDEEAQHDDGNQPKETHSRRWWHFWTRSPKRHDPAAPRLLAGIRSISDLEAERQRARGLYLQRAAELDKKIQQFNDERPRNLTWLEKTRLIPRVAAQQFDTGCPPLVS